MGQLARSTWNGACPLSIKRPDPMEADIYRRKTGHQPKPAWMHTDGLKIGALNPRYPSSSSTSPMFLGLGGASSTMVLTGGLPEALPVPMLDRPAPGDGPLIGYRNRPRNSSKVIVAWAHGMPERTHELGALLHSLRSTKQAADSQGARSAATHFNARPEVRGTTT